MSAIAGIYYRDGRPIQPADLDRMLTILAHRGPDGSGVWHEGSVGMGHRMLRTASPSPRECLPLVIHSGNLVHTVDARIDNRDELLAALQLTGIRPGAIGDRELILAAYRRWGMRNVYEAWRHE